MTPVSPNSQCGKILGVLADGKPHLVSAIHRRAGYSRLNSRVSELRKRGYEIKCKHLDGRGTGSKAYAYQWLNAPPLEPAPEPGFVIPGENIYPRDEENRIRIYRICEGSQELDLVATAPDDESAGVALVRLAREGEFARCSIGLLDTHASEDVPSTWIVNPWDPKIAY